jgi:hypothetical protein
MFRVFIFALIGVLAWSYWPTTAGYFMTDDFVFIAQSRMVTSPLSAFWTHHFYEPVYFRPLGILSWWLATHFFFLDYRAHSAINLVLHGINVTLVAILLLRTTNHRAASLAAAAIFAFFPLSVISIMHPSNRFDLLATTFLLALCLSSLSALRTGRISMLALAFLTTLAACASKELAYPVATFVALACLFAWELPLRSRATLFLVIGTAVFASFVWRNVLLPVPYLFGESNTLNTLATSAGAWCESALRVLASSFPRESGWRAFIAVLAIVTLLASVIGGLTIIRSAPRERWIVAMFCFAVFVSIIPQLPPARIFTSIVDGTVFGSAVYSRFYYAPTASVALLIGYLISRAQHANVFAATVTLISCSLSIPISDLGRSYAMWTQKEMRTMVESATRVVEQHVSNLKQQTSPCIVSLLGTQTRHPWFRQFSDVAVKAVTALPDDVWQCHVLTESTPWLFISRENRPLPEIGLPALTFDAKGSIKPDYAWGGVRYRYRLIVDNFSLLPRTQFYDWTGTEFTDVTVKVETGELMVRPHGWGL